jgi:hypothetical protein
MEKYVGKKVKQLIFNKQYKVPQGYRLVVQKGILPGQTFRAANGQEIPRLKQESQTKKPSVWAGLLGGSSAKKENFTFEDRRIVLAANTKIPKDTVLRGATYEKVS